MKRNCLASALGLFLACAIGAAAAEPAGPPADYKIDPEYTSTSSDGATIVEQYAKTDADGNYTWQFWARRGDKLTLLKPEQQDYAAGFQILQRFSLARAHAKNRIRRSRLIFV